MLEDLLCVGSTGLCMFRIFGRESIQRTMARNEVREAKNKRQGENGCGEEVDGAQGSNEESDTRTREKDQVSQTGAGEVKITRTVRKKMVGSKQRK